ncbi:MAG: Dabb family protein [Chlorobiaceae bacterium]|nr:Dabb family protein [Chlorobiaceae bacterium]NTW74449.1 Dabb family protein [Chlorobiaceae bacterium]
MIKHIVMWRLNASAYGNPAEVNARIIREKLEALRGRIPGLVSIEVGLDFSGSESSADVVLYSEFIDLKSLEGYQTHPEHEAVKAFIGGASAERRLVDYEA